MQPAYAYACDKTPTMASSPIVNAGLYLESWKGCPRLKGLCGIAFRGCRTIKISGVQNDPVALEPAQYSHHELLYPPASLRTMAEYWRGRRHMQRMNNGTGHFKRT